MTISPKIVGWRTLFPPISRKLTALLLPAVALASSAALFLNLRPTPQTKQEIITNQILTHPDQPAPHRDLARLFLANNDLPRAQTEALLAQKLSSVPDKKTSELLAAIRARESEPVKIGDRIAFWGRLVTQHPDFRDGHLHLALFFWQMGWDSRAQTEFERAARLDPNNESILEVGNFLKKRGSPTEANSIREKN